MSELEIPERAWRAFGAEPLAGNNLEAAAPIIVATELRKFVAALREVSPVGDGTVLNPRLVVNTIADDLQRRADELDPDGMT